MFGFVVVSRGLRTICVYHHTLSIGCLQKDLTCWVLLLANCLFIGLECSMTLAGCSILRDTTVVHCGGRMQVLCVRLWRLPVHCRLLPCSLSSLKGFTPELLKVLYVCVPTVSSARTAVAGHILITSAAGFSTLGLLLRSLLSPGLLVHKRSQKIYRRMWVQPRNTALYYWVSISKVRHTVLDLKTLWIKPESEGWRWNVSNATISLVIA